MDTPLVTIVLATYNGDAWIDALLESLVRQTEHRWTLLVADDGSTDRTLDIVRRFAAVEPRASITTGGPPPRSGATARFLDLLTKVDTPLWALCDQDDVWRPDKLAVTTERCLTFPAHQPAAVFTDAVPVDEHLSVLHPSAVHRRGNLAPGAVNPSCIALQNRAIGMTMVGNRSLARLATHRPELAAHAAMHDWWLALLAASAGRLDYLDEPTAWYRQHSSNASRAWTPWPAGRRQAYPAALSHRTAAIIGRAADQAAAVTELLGDRTPASIRLLGALSGQRLKAGNIAELQRHGVELASPIGQMLLRVGAGLSGPRR